jgi:hypothetical protein
MTWFSLMYCVRVFLICTHVLCANVHTLLYQVKIWLHVSMYREPMHLCTCVSEKELFLLAHACTQVHRFSQHSPADSAYLCETDVSKYVWQQRWCFWAHRFPVAPLLAHACTQVHRFSQHSPADSAYLCETDVSMYVWQQEWRNPVYASRIDSSSLVFKSFIAPILIYKFCL